MTPAVAAYHFQTLLDHSGVAAVLSRGELSCEIDAVLQIGTDTQVISTKDVRFAAGIQDVIIKAVDYCPHDEETEAADAITEPQADDKIVLTDGPYELTLEVRARSGSQDVCIELPTRQHWRVYTKIVNRRRV